MLYAASYNVFGGSEASWFVSESEWEVLEHARSMARIALDCMDYLPDKSEWFDTEGNSADIQVLLQAQSIDELRNAIEQLGETMDTDRSGFIRLYKYSNILALLDEQALEKECSRELQVWCDAARSSNDAIIRIFNMEWMQR